MLYVGLTISVIDDNDSSSTKPNDSSGPSSKWSLNKPLFPQLDPHEFWQYQPESSHPYITIACLP